MARIICATLSKGTQTEIRGSESVWSAVDPSTVISACLHDIGEAVKKKEVTESYHTRLSNWLTSGNEIGIIYVRNNNEIDVYQYDDDRD